MKALFLTFTTINIFEQFYIFDFYCKEIFDLNCNKNRVASTTVSYIYFVN